MNWNLDFETSEIRDIFISAALFIFAYIPSPFGFLIYFAFIPQLFLYARLAPVKALLAGYLLGFIINMVLLYWILPYSGFGYALIVPLNALQFAVFGLVFSIAYKYAGILAHFLFPFLWTTLEYIRQFSDLAFNWINIAHSQTNFLYLIQYVDITGITGIVFWICLLNLLFYLWIVKRKSDRIHLYGVSVLILLFALPLLYGYLKLSANLHAKGLSVAYIQPNVDPWQKWDIKNRKDQLQRLYQLTDSMRVTEPALVVWPETAFPFVLRPTSHFREVKTYAQNNKIYLLAGALDYSLQGEDSLKFNSTVFISPQGNGADVYHKLRLVPGEETIPFHEHFTHLGHLNTKLKKLSPGKKAQIFKLSGVLYDLSYNGEDWQIKNKGTANKMIAISTAICYESIFPNLVNRFFGEGSQLMTVITNDGWFGYSSQSFQHLRISVLRAIEHRSSLIQCANTGTSAFIDPLGRIFCQSNLFEISYAQKIVPIKMEETFYENNPNLLGLLCSIISVCFVILVIILKQKIIK